MSSPNFHKDAKWTGSSSAGNVQGALISGAAQRVDTRPRQVLVRKAHMGSSPSSSPVEVLFCGDHSQTPDWLGISHPTSRVGSSGVHTRLLCSGALQSDLCQTENWETILYLTTKRETSI